MNNPKPESPKPEIYYHATSNQTWDNLPVAAGRPGDTRTFRTAEEAIAWLKSLRCGGSVSDGDRVVREVLPGE
jgi:hypothetical protein